jgi:hypothetical protein
MKAVRVLEYGGQLVFDEVPTPTIARVPRSIMWILLRLREWHDRYSRSICRGYLVMSFPG